ncbi:MAG: type II secretion system protein F, partial [Actinobacteria bacterium]|nr:type II secretion system protein F [Actinomycetota bacterium]
MGALLGLVLGVGLLLVWRSGPRAPQGSGSSGPRHRWLLRRRDLLHQAGLGGVGPGRLVAVEALASVLAFLVGLAATSSVA